MNPLLGVLSTSVSVRVLIVGFVSMTSDTSLLAWFLGKHEPNVMITARRNWGKWPETPQEDLVPVLDFTCEGVGPVMVHDGVRGSKKEGPPQHTHHPDHNRVGLSSTDSKAQ